MSKKFPELFEWVSTHDVTVVRVEDNVIPVKGYAVPDDCESLEVHDDFDAAVSIVVRTSMSYNVGHIMIHDDRVAPCMVYASKEFALGYATGIGAPFILDLFTGKRIVVRSEH